ncbi:MAG TPA: hypothetical protein PLW35_01115 [Verrucomicrobiota bacterium]|nr:hypothetical protein [Verrucomicrobiota bacterium]
MKTAYQRGSWGAMLGVTVAALSICQGDNVPSTTGTNAPAALSPATDAAAGNSAEASEPTAKIPLQPPQLSPGVADIVELAQKGVGDTVLVEYVKKSAQGFDLSADEILYLKDIGVSEEVIAEMLKHKSTLAQEPTKTETVPAQAPAQPTSTESTSSVASTAAPATPEPPRQTEPAESTAASQPQPSVSSPPPVYTQPVTQVNNYFYSSLAPYGTWIELPSYGWVWQPACAVVVADWQPYCHGGYWVYTDAGWYWHSMYSWGWAPFHYGRWYRHHHVGWVWVPGYEWAPAWVTWRYSDMYCGWAPLPPGCGWSAGIGLTWYGSNVSFGFSFGLGWDCFTFVSYHHFCDRYVHHHRLPRHQTTVVYNNSTVINNYVVGNNNTIVNEGIPPKRISAVTRREIPKVQLRDVTSAPDGMRRAGRFEPRDKQLAVYRPKAAPDAAPPQPRPIRTSTVNRTSPAASLPTTAGFSERRSPSSTSSGQPVRSSAAGMSPTKPVAERTTTTTRQPVRTSAETTVNNSRPGLSSPTAKPGALAPRQASDGSAAPATPPTNQRSTVVRSENAPLTRKPAGQSVETAKPPVTRTEPRRIGTSSPAPVTTPAQTDNRVSVPRSTVSPSSTTTPPRPTPPAPVSRPFNQSSITAPAGSPSVTSRPKTSAPSTPVPASSIQPTSRSSAPALTMPGPISSQPPVTRAYSQPVSVPPASAPRFSSPMNTPSMPTVAVPSVSVPRASATPMSGTSPSLGSQPKFTPAAPAAPSSPASGPSRSGPSSYGRSKPQ